jgi:hypothetical protein
MKGYCHGYSLFSSPNIHHILFTHKHTPDQSCICDGQVLSCMSTFLPPYFKCSKDFCDLEHIPNQSRVFERWTRFVAHIQFSPALFQISSRFRLLTNTFQIKAKFMRDGQVLSCILSFLLLYLKY